MSKTFLRKVIGSMCLVLGALSSSGAAKADGWGCRVLLCLSNPAGPEAVSECVPPIEKLWQELAKLHPHFPTCDLSEGPGTSGPTAANYAFANDYNCPPQYIIYADSDNGPQPAGCTKRGAVTVNVNGKPFTKVWWQSGGASVIEFNVANPSASATYDADLRAYNDAVAVAAAAMTAANSGGN